MTNRYDNLRSLYQAARPDEEPTRADLRAVRTAMMSAGIAAVTFHASSAAGKLLTLASGSAKMFTLGQVVTYTAIGVAIGGGLATVGAVVQRNTAMHTAVSVAAPAQRPPSKRNLTVPPAPAESEPNPIERAELQSPSGAGAQPEAARVRSNRERRTAPMMTVEPLETPAPSARVVAERAEAPPTQSLLDESRGLAEVQVALGSGNIGRALHLLDEQDQAFRGGGLAQERSAARVIALCTAHRADAGVAKERFMTAYPGSPLVRRVSAACKNH